MGVGDLNFFPAVRAARFGDFGRSAGKKKQIECKLKVMGGSKIENAVQVSRILVQIARL